MKMLRLRFTFVLAGLLTCNAHALDGLRIDEVISAQAPQNFMGVVLVATADEIVLHRGYGYANLEWQVPNDRNSRFLIGSLTGQFTAAAILRLVDQERLSLTDPITDFLPDAPVAWKAVTVYQLLTHTSGLKEIQEMADHRLREPFPTSPETTIARVFDEPFDFEPGTGHAYNNTGYIILGYIVEVVSGMAWDEFLDASFFTPMDMQNTGYARNRKIIGYRAVGYTAGSDGLGHARYMDMTLPFAAGGLYSSAADLHIWMKAVVAGEVIDLDLLKRTVQPGVSEFGLGISEIADGNRIKLQHTGAINGFGAVVSYYPDQEVTTVVLSNLQVRSAVLIERYLSRLVRGERVTLIAEREEIELSDKLLDRYTGAYRFSDNFVVQISLANGGLYVTGDGIPRVAIFPEGNDVFFARSADVQFEFFRDSQGVYRRLVMRRVMGELEATRQAKDQGGT
jgi:CubicO group peptidase (beta-lactamase class C family)